MTKRTYKDRSEYMKMAVSKRRKKIKEMAVEYKGGKCCICGYYKCNSALDFHHRDETQKKLDKCILVCANCHREIHEGITQLPEETLVETSWDNGEG